MLRPSRLLLCASAAALILGVAPVGQFVPTAHAQIVIAVSAAIAPPLLPIYAQPPIPGPGYVWIPGYWAWDGTEYYWVPGYWALPPAADLLWTPAYWAWNDTDDDYVFNAGYWGPTVGYYGGIDYGFGYPGAGYDGGYWRNHQFYYNRAVNNLGTTPITTVYSAPVPAPVTTTRVAFNGGPGGATLRPTPAQVAFARERHDPPTAVQVQHQAAASKMADLRFNANHGRPPIAAVQRPNEFHGAHIAAATAAGAALGAAAIRAHELHAPAARAPHFAARAAPHFAARAAPHFAAHAPHFAARAAPHFAARAAPHFAAPHFAGGGMHFGGAPHFGGGGPHFGGGGGHRAP